MEQMLNVSEDEEGRRPLAVVGNSHGSIGPETQGSAHMITPNVGLFSILAPTTTVIAFRCRKRNSKRASPAPSNQFPSQWKKNTHFLYIWSLASIASYFMTHCIAFVCLRCGFIRGLHVQASASKNKKLPHMMTSYAVPVFPCAVTQHEKLVTKPAPSCFPPSIDLSALRKRPGEHLPQRTEWLGCRHGFNWSERKLKSNTSMCFVRRKQG